MIKQIEDYLKEKGYNTSGEYADSDDIVLTDDNVDIHIANGELSVEITAYSIVVVPIKLFFFRCYSFEDFKSKYEILINKL